MRTTNKVRVAGLAVLLGLSVGGCSGSGPGGVSQLIPNAIAPGPPEMSADQFCAASNKMAETALEAPSPTSTTRPSQAESRDYLRRMADDSAKLAEVAPIEIRADLQTEVETTRQVADGKIDVTTALQDKSGATHRVADWYRQHCPPLPGLPRPPVRPGPSN